MEVFSLFYIFMERGEGGRIEKIAGSDQIGRKIFLKIGSAKNFYCLIIKLRVTEFPKILKIDGRVERSLIFF